MKRLLVLFIVIFCVFVTCFSQYDEHYFHDKLPFEEAQVFLKKATFIEDRSYADYDLTFQRMQWTVDPSEHFIQGAITSYFKSQKNDFSSICFDLADQLQVDSVLYHGEKITFTHQSNKLNIQLVA